MPKDAIGRGEKRCDNPATIASAYVKRMLTRLRKPGFLIAMTALHGSLLASSMSEGKEVDAVFISECVLAPSSEFRANRHFLEGATPPKLQISWIGSNFKKVMLKKNEGPLGRRSVAFYGLKASLSTRDIADALNDKIDVALHDVWQFLSAQPTGGPGVLRTDSVPNLFFVRDGNGKRWAVDAVWGGAGWEIGASRADGRYAWTAGSQIALPPGVRHPLGPVIARGRADITGSNPPQRFGDVSVQGMACRLR